MHYFLILALQGFCIYHAIKNRNHYYWFFVIIFLPVIGSIIYLFTQVFNKRDLDVVQGEIVNVINPTKKVKDLQKKVEFADTFQNRVLLGDALFEIRDYASGIGEYEMALNGNYEQDTGVVKKLIEGYYKTEQYDKVIFCAEKITHKNDFKGSRSQFLYGLSLEESGRSEEAERNLKPIDQRYSNYQERYELAQFLIKKEKTSEAKDILFEIITESEHMSKPNKNKYRVVVDEVRKLMASLP
ncbi:hypothetical protein [Aquimarina sp. 2201CG5-10]|uniref:hypothetical protein n=1 Tax=Aquimarina callyspongiae TaxID=3098150 RepID=UPI002AB5BC02|nr:hypothetical protein [Aquimarina sp. 2201CG5-10]MDY8134204.1 hypothetical protein [Aquimarina sp. 2201CG5-10]